MKSIFFWDMTPCSALSGTRRFGGTYRLHLQGCRIVQRSMTMFSVCQFLKKYFIIPKLCRPTQYKIQIS
jgi:hypothetical protein